MAQVSTLYYLDGRSQENIAKRFRISRSKVSRLLCAARKAGIARITVTSPPGVLATLEVELEARFTLREVRVVPLTSGGSPEMDRQRIGIAAAADFARTVKDGHAIGIVGGALLASMIDAVPPMVRTGVRVVQGAGWEHAPTERTLMGLVWDLASRIHAAALMLPVPSVPSSEAMRRGLG
jgi:DNA-binding transcriptional regulator LsrR (DeoR family)